MTVPSHQSTRRRAATMQDVADMLHVSKQTVSAVINNKPGITAETRTRVLDAIAQINYRMDLRARSLRTSAGAASAFIIMTTSMLAGAAILSFFGISISAFQIAGGILLGGTGMSMLSAKGSGDVHGKEVEKPVIDRSTLVSTMIVPVTLPLTTGAGTISTVTVFAHEAAQAGQEAHQGISK